MGYYEVVVESHIDKKRERDFQEMELIHLEDGNTLLSGVLADQAQLFFILNKVRDMNLTLLSVKKNNRNMEV